MEILRTENLSKVYHGAHEVQALNEVNLSVEKGSLLQLWVIAAQVSPLFAYSRWS